MIREKLYRDPVHDLIALDQNSAEDSTLISLIDTPEMQRLRRVRQLGMAGIAFQGAEHSRFTHSLGVMWVATRILLQLSKHRAIPADLAFATRCAALLHDVGHGPLSHVFEKFLKYHHERWTERIILSPDSCVNRVLAAHSSRLPGQVANVISGNVRPAFLKQIISSQLDADRFDYLLRDSMMTGVKYGIYDFERILHILRLDKKGQNILIAANGVLPVEKYLQSRYHMYAQVYLHKTVRSAELMLGRMLERAAELTSQGQLPALHSSEPLARLLKRKARVELSDYLEIDDDTIFSCMKRWKSCEDPILCDLANRLLERQIFKTVDVTRIKGLDEKAGQARALIARAGLDPRYYFAIDTSGDVPYRPYSTRSSGTMQQIMVETRDGKGEPRDIHSLSEVVAGLTRAAFTVKRAMFPEKAGRTDLRRAMKKIFEAE